MGQAKLKKVKVLIRVSRSIAKNLTFLLARSIIEIQKINARLAQQGEQSVYIRPVGSSSLSTSTKGEFILNFFINRESLLSHRYRMSGISITYRKYMNIDHQKQIIIESRIMEMTPAQYLRYLRDKGAKFAIAVNTYITYYFEDSALLDKHLADLNNRFIKILTKVK